MGEKKIAVENEFALYSQLKCSIFQTNTEIHNLLILISPYFHILHNFAIKSA